MLALPCKTLMTFYAVEAQYPGYWNPHYLNNLSLLTPAFGSAFLWDVKTEALSVAKVFAKEHPDMKVSVLTIQQTSSEPVEPV